MRFSVHGFSWLSISITLAAQYANTNLLTYKINSKTTQNTATYSFQVLSRVTYIPWWSVLDPLQSSLHLWNIWSTNLLIEHTLKWIWTLRFLRHLPSFTVGFQFCGYYNCPNTEILGCQTLRDHAVVNETGVFVKKGQWPASQFNQSLGARTYVDNN